MQFSITTKNLLNDQADGICDPENMPRALDTIQII
jgi:hypothetical protein